VKIIDRLRLDKAAVVTSSEENVSNQAGILKSAKCLVFLVLVIKGRGTLRVRGVRHGGEFPWLTCLEIDIKLKLQNLAGIS